MGMLMSKWLPSFSVPASSDTSKPIPLRMYVTRGSFEPLGHSAAPVDAASVVGPEPTVKAVGLPSMDTASGRLAVQNGRSRMLNKKAAVEVVKKDR